MTDKNFYYLLISSKGEFENTSIKYLGIVKEELVAQQFCEQKNEVYAQACRIYEKWEKEVLIPWQLKTKAPLLKMPVKKNLTQAQEEEVFNTYTTERKNFYNEIRGLTDSYLESLQDSPGLRFLKENFKSESGSGLEWVYQEWSYEKVEVLT